MAGYGVNSPRERNLRVPAGKQIQERGSAAHCSVSAAYYAPVKLAMAHNSLGIADG